MKIPIETTAILFIRCLNEYARERDVTAMKVDKYCLHGPLSENQFKTTFGPGSQGSPSQAQFDDRSSHYIQH